MAALGLPTLPRTIEGYDISNTGGEESVGSVVVFEDGLPQKEKYRKYRIESVRGPNDVASLEEVIRRRYTKILEEKRERPDLILVDGGKGQLQAALKSLAAVGAADIPVISLAKREETIFSPDHKEGIRFDRTSPALKLFQNIRDEAHRFAVSFHRRRREKRSFESVLDDVPGLGKKRKAALLSLYKSTAAMRKAGLAELAKITGPKVAEELLKRI
jgi:excinuclease ABC subunit C